MNDSPLSKTIWLSLFFLLLLVLPASGKEKKEEKAQKNLIEEIEVTGKAPAAQPVSSVSAVDREKIEKTASSNLSEIVNTIPGVHVSEGQKTEANINIRGLGSSRVTLMVDGIPIYEPYFNSFDLKSFSAAGIEKVKVIRGSSSVLYGPNALGGVINIITLRPEKNFFSFDGNFSENSSWFLSGTGAYQKNRFAIISNLNFDTSDGFDLKNEGKTERREWSDYSRRNFSTRVYYSPNENSEMIGEVFYTNSEYRIPPAMDYFKERYWHFRDWDRLQLNLGSLLPLGEKGFVKIRTYYVRHFNVLDDYSDSSMEMLRWESTYKNSAYGITGAAEYSTAANNLLKFSLNANFNRVNTQDDTESDWERFRRNVYSIALEDHWKLSEKLQLTGGVSFDVLYKDTRETVTALNPIIGLKYSPGEYASYFVSYSRKSRFPSMKSLYSGSSGNPGLVEETGNTFELGLRYDRGIHVSASMFHSVYTDLIQSYRGLDGYRNYLNIGKAVIRGAEVSIGKTVGRIDLNLSYTYLDSEEDDIGLPLDYTPEHQIGVFMSAGPFSGFTLNVWGTGVTESFAKLGKEPPFEMLRIPEHFMMNLMLEKTFGAHSLYIKISNAFDTVYFTEPGFPARDRRIVTGIRFNFN